MTLFILMILLSMSVSFLFTNHPLSMGLILMCQTISTALITGMMMKNFWLSYILFMIMIGGMLILFLYMTSVASNKKFKFSWKLFLLNTSMIIPLIMITKTNDFLMNLMFIKQVSLELLLSKFFNMPTNSIMIILIIYLLITLIAVVKITSTNFGPLRQK